MCSLGHRYIVCDSFIDTILTKENKGKEAAVATAGSKPALVLPGSNGCLEVKSTGGEEGRGVYATRAIKAFEKVLVSNSYAQVSLNGTCASCMGAIPRTSKAGCACIECGVQYCSEACAIKAKPMHKVSKECEILVKIGALIADDSDIPDDIVSRERRVGADLMRDAKKAYPLTADRMDFVLMCITLAKAFAERYVLKGGEGEADLALCGVMDDSFATGECPYIGTPKDGEPTIHSVQEAEKDDLNVTFADVSQMTTNLNHFRTFELRRLRDMHALYMEFQRVLPQLLPRVSEDLFVNLQCANMCNTFGSWDARTDAACGQSIFPIAALQNHSCAPNVFHQSRAVGGKVTMYAIRDIAAGEEVFMSYTEPRHGLTERRGHLKNSQHFTCHCLRCDSDEKGISTADTFDPETAMCQRCKARAYMVPPNLAAEGNLDARPLRCIECGL